MNNANGKTRGIIEKENIEKKKAEEKKTDQESRKKQRMEFCQLTTMLRASMALTCKFDADDRETMQMQVRRMELRIDGD